MTDNKAAPTTPRLTVDTVVHHMGRILLIRRGKPPFQGAWAFPGGFVDVGETVEAAAVRETREETGLDVELEHLLGVWSDPARDPRGHTVSVVYIGAPLNADEHMAVRGQDDAAHAEWFPLHTMPPLAFDHADILIAARRYLSRKGVRST